MKLSTLLIFFVTSPCLLFSQIFYNNGATVWTGPTSIVRINGGLENSSSGPFIGDIEHNGDMTIASNPASSFGNVTLSNNSVMHGNGTYYVEQDWVNNATFTANNSTVELYGNIQEFITGTNITTFHNLTLTGTGSGINTHKTQTLDAIIDATGIMNINDRELETDTNTMFVMNPSVAAVDNDSLVAGSEGFVSSIAPGYLHRETNTASSYVFPVGSSSNNLTRYRPIRIVPTAATPTHYNVRFINYNSDNDGFLRTSNDGVMCQTIDTFYHAIDPNPLAVVPADISIYYKSVADGNWNGTAHWRTTNTMWNNMANIGSSGSNGFDVNTRPNWLFANPGFPYLLTNLRAPAPQISCQNLCENTQGTFYLTPGSGVYNWTTPGGTIISGQGTSTITVAWTGTSGYVFAVDSTNPACKSLPDSCLVTAYPGPNANFDTLSIGPFNTSWNFLDSSTAPPLTWYWMFGDGGTDTIQNPSHNYLAAGTYTVTQIVTSQYGCIDTITKVITVNEGVIIPNVFTPDANGFNDVWYIPNSGVKEFTVTIYDRWGAKVWGTTADEIRWDGRTLSGQMLSNGTYYYVLSFVFIRSSGEETKNLNGYVTLLTNK